MYPGSLVQRSGVLVALCLSLLTAGGVAAQEGQSYTLQGTVVDANTQRPLASVAVLIRGTQQGTLTDNAGRYTLVARVQPGSYTLQYSLIGRGQQTREVTLGAERSLRLEPVALQETAVQLEEIVVTGTGAPTQRRALGNAVSTVSGENMAASPAVSVDAALQGKVPGAQIMSNTGQPGGGVSVRLRGTSSITGGAEPLYIIDGVIVDNSSDEQITGAFGARSHPTNRLADLNPNDIERVEVLKGAAAAALYGSRANNGVIQIFTRRGAVGAPSITVETRTTRGDLPRRLHFNSFERDAQGNPVQRFDNEGLIFREAWGNETFVSVSGGADQTRYYLGGSYANQQGIMLGSDHEKINVRLNLDQTLGGWLTLSGGANYINTSTGLVIGGEQATGGLLTAIVFTPNTVDFSARDPETGRFVNRGGAFPNPLEVVEDWSSPQDVSRFVGSFQARATPLAGASLEYRLGYDTYNMETRLFIPRGSLPSPLGSATAALRAQNLINNDLVGSFQFDATPALQLTTTAGMNHTFSRQQTVTASARDLTPYTELVRGAIQSSNQNRFETATLGYFAQQQIGLNNRLFLTGALRWDASSTFGAEERWQLYPKLSGSYVLSEEPFWQNTPLGNWFDSFRLRAALGYAGNQPPVGSAYARYSLYTGEINIDRLGLRHESEAGNPALRPERQREIEGGLDISVLGDRVGVAFTYYNQYVEDLLLTRPFAPSTGYASVLDNVGELSNRGVELQLTSRNVDSPVFGWNTTVNYARNRNRVEQLAGFPFSSGYINRVQVGQPLGVFRTTDYRRDPQGNIVYDTIAACRGGAACPFAVPGRPLPADTLSIIGDPNPDFQLSLQNEFRIGRNLHASVLLDGVFGFDVWNQTQRIMDNPARGTGPAYERELRGEVPPGYALGKTAIAGAYIEDGSFLKLREMTLRYQIDPQFTRRVGMSTVSLEVTGRNLYTWTDYSGYDPEVNMFGTLTVARGTDFAVYPNARQFGIGIRANY